MDLYYNDQKISTVPIIGQTTIGQIKKMISDWLVPQGITNYVVRLFFNNNTELSSVVFTTNTYDGSNLVAQEALLPGGSIRVNLVPSVSVPSVPVPEVKTNKTDKTNKTKREFTETESYILTKYDDQQYLFNTKEDAYEWLLEIMVDKGFDLEDIGMDEDDIPDYDDEDFQDTIDEFIEGDDDDTIKPTTIYLME